MDTTERWKIDAERSTLRFSLPHAALGQIKGQFHCWGGEVSTDPRNPRRSKVRIWVELSSLETGSRRRDKAILHTELFDQDWEPGLEFDGERLEIDASNHMTLVGWLGLHSLRRQISIDLTAGRLALDPSGDPRFVCTAKATIDRRSLGLKEPRAITRWLKDRLVGQTIEVLAHVEAVRDLRTGAAV
jgi:polyisoprenoid-binding protein YceI